MRREGRPAPAVAVRCFGGFDVTVSGRDLTVASSAAEAAQRAPAWEVLAYLASHAEGVVGRDDLLQAIWPDTSSRTALTNLSGALEQLNAMLGDPHSESPVWLDEREGVVRLDPASVESDVHRFLRLCHAAPMMPAAEISPPDIALSWPALVIIGMSSAESAAASATAEPDSAERMQAAMIAT